MGPRSASPSETMTATMDSYLGRVKGSARRLSRATTIFIGVFFSITFVLVTLALAAHSSARVRAIVPNKFSNKDSESKLGYKPLHWKYPPRVPTCEDTKRDEKTPVWKATLDRYSNLIEDKFTIAMQTYHRPVELNDTLNVLLTEEIPSLHEVVIVWNAQDEDPPEDWISELGIPVRYRKSPVNSLNQKLVPDPQYETQAVFLSDDDVYYYPSDLEFAFHAWRTFGRQRLTGAMPRATAVGQDGEWRYMMPKQLKDEDYGQYSLIITNLAFSHVAFLDYYSSNDPVMNRVRDYVDDHLNCEDIAMNYVHSFLSGTGPLLVKGEKEWFSMDPAEGISRKKGHMAARSKCMNDLAEMFGCMPLVDETVSIQRGRR